MKIGVISDTHDLLRPQAVAALRGVDHIVHAGDICGTVVLNGLGEIAPVSAVRGNNDRGDWAAGLQETLAIELGGATICVLHDLSQLDLDPAAAGFQVVISGHSHRPLIETRDEVLYINPGSAGPRRFKLPIALAILEISGGKLHAKLRMLDI
jgi:putative phosphoesterase